VIGADTLFQRKASALRSHQARKVPVANAPARAVATLVGSGGVPADQTNALVAEAAALFTATDVGGRPVGRSAD
jgi:glutamyl-tRNA reductase